MVDPCLLQSELNFANANYLEYAVVQLTPPNFNLYYQMLTHIKISGCWMENKPNRWKLLIIELTHDRRCPRYLFVQLPNLTITNDQKEAYKFAINDMNQAWILKLPKRQREG